MNRVMPIQSLVGQPASTIAIYGSKAEGLVNLHAVQPASPVHFLIPEHWAVPAPSSRADASMPDIRHAYDAITRGMTEEGVVMVRSSAIGEEPGQHPTLSVRYNPLSPQVSWKKFTAAFDKVYSTSPDMGVLLTRMVGTTTMLKNGTRAFGLSNVSFVADSHSVVDPHELFIAAVTGLGTRAVEKDDVIGISAHRKGGYVTHIANRNHWYLHQEYASARPPTQWSEYRQELIDFFSLTAGSIASRAMSEREFKKLTRLAYLAPEGIIMRDERTEGGADIVGHLPFGNSAQPRLLIGALQFLAERYGSVQIEGAFPQTTDSTLYLYQLLSLPPSPVAGKPIVLKKRHLSSHYVTGMGRFEAPLVWLRERYNLDELALYDQEHAETGYILLASIQDLAVIKASPNCIRRLSWANTNRAKHAVTLTRMRAAREPERGHLFASSVQATGDESERLSSMEPDQRIGNLLIWDRAIVESNGIEMGVEIVQPPPQKKRRRWWPW